jgi:hypothetical protein
VCYQFVKRNFYLTNSELVIGLLSYDEAFEFEIV